jgi:hypothetical protein
MVVSRIGSLLLFGERPDIQRRAAAAWPRIVALPLRGDGAGVGGIPAS